MNAKTWRERRIYAGLIQRMRVSSRLACLQKPFAADMLVTAVQKALGKGIQ